MSETVFFDTLRQGLWVATLISTPILTAALVAGVSVGLFQALTSIQEMTLSYVPKMVVVVIILFFSFSFMLQFAIDFMARIFDFVPEISN